MHYVCCVLQQTRPEVGPFTQNMYSIRTDVRFHAISIDGAVCCRALHPRNDNYTIWCLARLCFRLGWARIQLVGPKRN